MTDTGPLGTMKATGTASVALTFDDGPDPVQTPRLLNLLKRYGVKATFCLVGTRARTYPGLVRRISDEGHTLCNHSWQHRMDLGKQANEVILADLQLTNEAIHDAAPAAKISYFRAPGGQFSDRLVTLAATLGMRSLYWSLDTRDWEFATYGRGQIMADNIIWAVQTYTRQGSIVLAHDLRKPDTITAFVTLLPWLRKHFKLIALPR